MNRDLLNECIGISGSLPDGDGQCARASYKASQLYHEQGKGKESEEYLKKAKVMRRRISLGDVLEEDESIELYNKLNLWMLW